MPDALIDSKPHFFNLIISDLILLCSFIFSSPLYIPYIIFFSPYILKLISFLSPILLTASLAFLTGIAHEDHSTDSDCASSKNCFDLDEGLQGSDDLGMYEVLFGTCLMNCVSEIPLQIRGEKSGRNQESGSDKERDSSFCKLEAKKLEEKIRNPRPIYESKKPCPGIEGRRLNDFLKILDQFERMSTANIEEKKEIGMKIDKAAVIKGVRYNAATKVSVHGGNNNKTSFESFGSMSNGKEWKRTLACKLFEERHNVDVGEGMDSLWEAYETNSDKLMKNPSEKKERNKKMSEIEFPEECYRDEEDEGKDEVVDGQLCCLSAIKLSNGRLNLGLKRSNLVKISKAVRGFGWLHHVSKHSKKVHSNGDR